MTSHGASSFLILVFLFYAADGFINLAGDHPCGKTKSLSLFSHSADNNNNKDDVVVIAYSRDDKKLEAVDKVDFEDVPHTVDLRNNGNHTCWGSLIHKQYVLTAGHCFRGQLDPKPWEVILGDRQTRGVEDIQVHDSYKYPNHRFDLAVLRLDKPVQWSDHVQPICLPKAPSSLDFKAYTGLGFMAARSKSYSHEGMVDFSPSSSSSSAASPSSRELKLVKLPILDNKLCEQWFLNQNQSRTMHGEYLCAGYEHGEQDGCQGDSGSGLVTLSNEEGGAEQQSGHKLVLLGVMSWGVGCKRLPGVYTRVEMFVDWVQGLVKKQEGRRSRKKRRTMPLRYYT